MTGSTAADPPDQPVRADDPPSERLAEARPWGGFDVLDDADAVDIPRGAAHRVANRGDEELVFVEVQLGEYFGEDDVTRLSDDYGRIDGSSG